MMNVSSNEKFTFKICSDINKTNNDSSDGGSNTAKDFIFRDIFRAIRTTQEKEHSLAQFKINNNI